jgi:alpha-ribazole phosphatase
MLIDLMRHGSTGRSGFLDGRTDPELTPEGWVAFEAQTRGRQWSHIVSSPRRRAHAAAEGLAATTTTPLTTDNGWAEYDFGAWDGRGRSEIEQDSAGRESLAKFYADPIAHPPPGAEPWLAFAARVSAALHRVIDLGNGPVLVVTHAGPIRQALALATGITHTHTWAFRIAYGTRLRLKIGRGVKRELWAEIIELVQPSSAGH